MPGDGRAAAIHLDDSVPLTSSSHPKVLLDVSSESIRTASDCFGEGPWLTACGRKLQCGLRRSMTATAAYLTYEITA